MAVEQALRGRYDKAGAGNECILGRGGPFKPSSLGHSGNLQERGCSMPLDCEHGCKQQDGPSI
eukprot:1618760-Pyramimonas_sp.AAC.2